MKKTIKKFFNFIGLDVRKAGTSLPFQQPPFPNKEDSMEAGMIRARDKFGVHPSSIIDLGAAEGTWTIKAEKVWSTADFILFEPLEERKKDLTKLAKKNPRVTPVFAAVGNRTGKIKFVVTNDLDGSGVYDAETTGEGREVEITTIDTEMKKQGAKSSYLIKFDTHGFEVPILEGANETLKKTQLIIMECYGFRISKNCLLFSEMCEHMQKSGFRLADIINVKRRPGDGLFWQCDAFFIRSDNPVFQKESYI